MKFNQYSTLESIQILAEDLKMFWEQKETKLDSYFRVEDLEMHLFNHGHGFDLSRLNRSEPLKASILSQLKTEWDDSQAHRLGLLTELDKNVITETLKGLPFFNTLETNEICSNWCKVESLSLMFHFEKIDLKQLQALIRYSELPIPVNAFFRWMAHLQKDVSKAKSVESEKNAYIEAGLVVNAIHCMTSGDANELNIDTLYSIGVNTDKTFTTPCKTDRLTFDANSGWTDDEGERWDMDEQGLPYNNIFSAEQMIEM